MPKELPGFYYDAEKNRYFPLKGPIPGSASSRASSSSSTANAQKPSSTKDTQDRKASMRCRARKASKLIHARELNGNAIITSKKGKHTFMQQFLELHASQPQVWKYENTKMVGDGALEQTRTSIQTPEGVAEGDVLITGSINGSLSLFEVGKVGERFVNGVKCIPDRVWPFSKEDRAESSKPPPSLWRSALASIHWSSAISCIKLCGEYSAHIDDSLNVQKALITTLGSEAFGGALCLLNLVQPLDLYSSRPWRLIHEIASLNCTIWTADTNPIKRQAVIGSNIGAALVDLETGVTSWVCRSKSDVLAQQFDQSANTVLCGLRNGAIVTVDVRENPERSARLIRHQIPYSSLGRRGGNSSKQWFELKGNIYPSCTAYMSSSVCCLVSLQLYDQYFLASSMDGSIKLYDHRMGKRGFIQSYEGHVNSHTRSQLRVDQSEKFLVSGGGDCNLRLWSITSGEMLFEERIFESFPSTVSWWKSESILKTSDESIRTGNCMGGENLNWGAWFGSQEGLFHMHWS